MIATSARLKGGQEPIVDEVGDGVGADAVGEVAERAAGEQPAATHIPGRVGLREKR